MEIYWGILFFWIGLSVGSFINMLVYRTEILYGLRKKIKYSPVNRSYCDYCGSQLRWFDNIPVISWLVLRGRSHCCRKSLPIAYPLLELSLGLFFLTMSADVEKNGLLIIVKLVMISLMLFSAIFDWRHMVLPDFSTGILVLLAFVMWYIYGGDLTYLYASIGSFLFLLILHLVTKGQGMGMGDVKYAIFMGLLLGIPKTILAFYFAFIGGAVFGITLIMIFRKKKNSRIPFGPFLILATFISWFWGEKLLLFFYRWF